MWYLLSQMEQSGRPRTRVRSISLQDLEAQSQARDTQFKREVRHALSSQVKSPIEELIEEEESLETKNREIQSKRRFNRIINYAGLTPKQLACYKLSKNKRYPRLELIARKLGISISSAWSRLNRAEIKIEKVLIRFLEGKRINELIIKPLYRPILKTVFHLYYERAWPPKKIAKATKRELSTIYKHIQKLKWLAHAYSPKEARKSILFKIGSKTIKVPIKKPSKKPRYYAP